MNMSVERYEHLGNKKKSVMIWLICDYLSFYAHVHTCSPSYTDEK